MDTPIFDPAAGIPPLIVLDVQDAINRPVWDGKNNPSYIDVIEMLLKAWRAASAPVVHVKHDEANPSSSYHTHGPWNAIQARVAPLAGEPVVTKTENCAFIGTTLDQTLKDLGAARFILTGVVIHNSMDATIRAGAALGYEILLPADATTAVPVKAHSGKIWTAAEVYDLFLAVLGGEYATITSSDALIRALAGD
ncbi:MAG: isochorismatase family protein [Pseudomonadota bacterium]